MCLKIHEQHASQTQGRNVIAWVNLLSDRNWNPDRSESEVGLPATTVRLSVSDIGPRSVKHDRCDCDKLLTVSVLSAHACEVTHYNHVQRGIGSRQTRDGMLMATPACRPSRRWLAITFTNTAVLWFTILLAVKMNTTHQSLSFTYHRRCTISEAVSVVKQNAKNYFFELVHSSVFLKYHVSETVRV